MNALQRNDMLPDPFLAKDKLTMENDFLKKALQHFKDHHPPAVVSGEDACLKKSSKARRKAKP